MNQRCAGTVNLPITVLLPDVALVDSVFAGGFRSGQFVQGVKYPNPDRRLPFVIAMIPRQSLVYRIYDGLFAMLQ